MATALDLAEHTRALARRHPLAAESAASVRLEYGIAVLEDAA